MQYYLSEQVFRWESSIGGLPITHEIHEIKYPTNINDFTGGFDVTVPGFGHDNLQIPR